MKHIINSRRIISIILCFTFFVNTVNAQLVRQFKLRYSANVYGDFLTIGNNVLSTTATGNYTGSDDNQNLTTVFVDIDNDATTFNSSSANFKAPYGNDTCITVKKVFLYWAAADFEENNIANEPN